MEVKFIKDHLDHKIGDKANLYSGLANYLIRVGVAKENLKQQEPKKGTKPKK